jgi:nitrogen fixation NifU-like protein
MSENSEVIPEVSDLVLEHLMNPRNYGEIKDCDSCGIGYDDRTGEFAVIYLKVKDDVIEDIKFSAKACQDTIVAGSMFSEMVERDTIKNALEAVLLVREKIKNAPPAQRACTSLILTAFEAAVKNLNNRKNGVDEEVCKMKIAESCEVENG